MPKNSPATLVRATDGRITSWSPAAAVLLGFEAQEVLGRPVSDLIPSDCAASDPAAAPVTHATAVLAPVRTRRRHRDGRQVAVWVTCSPVLDHLGQVVGVVEVLVPAAAEVAPPDQAELSAIIERLLDETRSESEARLHLALQAARMGVWEWEFGTDRMYWSHDCRTIMSRPDFDGTISGFGRVVHPDDAARVLAEARAAVAANHDLRTEFRIVQQGGAVRWVENLGRLFRGQDGEPTRMVGAVRDITDRKVAQEGLRRERERLALALHATRTGVWEWDIRTHDVTWSRECYEIVGLQMGQFDGTLEGFERLIHPDDAEEVARRSADAVGAREQLRIEFRIIRPDGQVRWLENVARAEYDATGVPLRMLGTVRDVTEERVFQEQLRQGFAAFRHLAEGLPHIAWTSGPDGEEQFINQRGLSYFGLALEDVRRRWRELVEPGDLAAFTARREEAFVTGEEFAVRIRLRRYDGALRWHEARSAPVRDADGQVIQWVGSLTDIHDAVEHEARLHREEERLAKIAAIAVSAVHSFRVPVTGPPHFAYASPTLEGIYGLPLAELRRDASSAIACFHPDDRERFFAAIDTSAREMTPFIEETRFCRPDGAVRWLEVRSMPVREPDGATVWHGVIHDITERKAQEDAIRASEERVQTILEHLGEAVVVLDRGGQVLSWNHAAVRMHEFASTDEWLLRLPELDRYFELRTLDGEVVPVAEWPASRILAGERLDGWELEVRRLDRPWSRVFRYGGGLVDLPGGERVAAITIGDVTARVAAEREIRQWADAFTHCALGVVVGAPDQTFLACNPAFEALVGASPGGLTHTHVADLYHPDDREKVRATIAASDRDGQARHESRLQRRDGGTVLVQVNLTSVRGPDGVLRYRIATIQDVSQRRAAAESMRGLSDRLQAILHSSPLPIVALDDRSQVLLWNHAAEQLFGWPAEDVMGRELPIIPKDREREHEGLRRQVLGGRPFRNRLTQRMTRDRRRIDVSISTAPLHDATGRVMGLVATYVDLTEQHSLREALSDSEKRFAQLFRASPTGIAILRVSDRTIVEINEAMAELSGYRPEEVVGRKVTDMAGFISPQFHDLLWQRLDAQGRLAQVDYPYHRRDGTPRHGLVTAERIRLGDEDVVLGVFLDVTERRAAEAALQESESRFRQLAESIREVFWLSTADQRQILYVSPAYEAIWGRTCDSLYVEPDSWLESVHPDDRRRVQQAAAARPVGSAYEEQYRIVRPDGVVRWVRVQAFPVRNAAGEVERIAGVAEDVTSRRQLEAQLRQTQKMESIGLLAGGVAHDFNNWLTVIAGNAELLLEEAPEGDDCSQLIGEIIHAGERAAALTRQLLAFSRREVIEPQVLDLNTVIVDTEKMLRRLLGEDILLATALAPTLPRVRIDPGQWAQVLLNLAVNARDAMPTGGRLTIETRTVELESPSDTCRRTGLAGGRYVQLAVSDTGAGMPAEVAARVFEPFFTTKGRGKGTGLGLAVVHGIVAQAGGAIDLYSEVGFGSAFKIYLTPVSAEATGDRLAPEATEVAGTETILLVEDEESVRRVAALALRQQGYTLLTAGDGQEALAVLERHAGPVHLLLTDVVMPHMDGRQLATAVTARFPGLRVLYTSGYTDDAVMRHGILQAEVAFLSKPYTPSHLLRRVRQVLDRR